MRRAQFFILKNILEKVTVPDYIHAFEKDRSIPMMAAQHVGKKVVLSLDLKDFFTSIKQTHLFELFQNLGFAEDASRTLSELCTYKAFVPQGALTSPKLSNIITAYSFGPIIKSYCDSKGYTLTIYADDITISSDHKFDGTEDRDTVASLIGFVRQTLSSFGFRLNNEKIKLMNNYQRQYVCGAVVNQKVNMQKTERNKLRAIIHNCSTNGIEAEAAKNEVSTSEFAAKVMGRLNWFSQLNPTAGNIIKNRFKQIVAEQCQPNVYPSENEIEIPQSSYMSEPWVTSTNEAELVQITG